MYDIANPKLSDWGSHLIPDPRPEGSSPLFGTARYASGTSGEDEIHLGIGNSPLPMRAVTSLRKLTSSFSLPHDVYRQTHDHGCCGRPFFLIIFGGSYHSKVGFTR